MYLPIESQPDCALAWLKAVDAIHRCNGQQAYNVVLDIEAPCGKLNSGIVNEVDTFLRAKTGKSIVTVANTIFPQALYVRHGSEFKSVFHATVLPKIKKNRRWSGYYFERMTKFPKRDGNNLDQLSEIVRKLADPENGSRNKFELSLFDPERDVDDSPYGGQCLSFLSFKVSGARNKKQLNLTAMYRNHYYIEKLLGNLVGLGNLLSYMAKEGGISPGHLTVISTHATIDRPAGVCAAEVTSLIERCLALAGDSFAGS